ncbi:MAG: hypothetical protein J1G01_06090 [Clostridiales bacterium]|nr:hypothetical protein [Clostridiales bacterium]
MWWNSMSAFQQTLFIVACAATFILIVQIILMLIGTDEADATGGGLSDGADGGLSPDIGGDGDLDVHGEFNVDGGDGGSDFFAVFALRLLSFRCIIAFFAIGAWIGYTVCYSLQWYYALIIAIACGFAAACGMAAAITGLEKLQSSGNINPANAVGKTGTVYLTVPPSRSGRGKVNILIQERFAEYEAVTDSDKPLPTMSDIKVLGHIGSNILLVEEYRKPSL